MNPKDADASAVLARAGLPDPLHRELRAPSMASPDETWRELQARLDAARPGRKRTWVVGAVAAAVVAVLVLIGGLTRLGWRTELATQRQTTPATSHESTALAASDHRDAPLTLANGEPFRGLSLASDAKLTAGQRTARFRDGSTVVGSPGTVVEPLALTGREVVLRLVEGRVDVHVIPGGSRKWVIEAGVLGVEVVGTRFTVERGPQGVEVRVREGAVLVRSPGLRDGVQRLTAGEAVALANTATQPHPSAAPPQSAPPVPSSSPPAGVDELLQRADQARLSGDLSRARSALETVLARHADDPRAALAAYQLALVREQQGERGSAVVAAFASACERAVGGSLRQDCYFRLSRAQARAGQRREARSTAERSLREFPQGRHAERLRRFVSGQADGP